MDVDDNPLTFGEAQQGTGKLVVVECRRHDMVGRQFGQSIGDAQSIIGPIFDRRIGRPGKARRDAHERREAGKSQK